MKKYEKLKEGKILKFVCIIFSVFAFVTLLYDYYLNEIAISTAIIAVFDVVAVLLVVIPSKHLQHHVIIHHQYDSHFVDRTNECEKTLSFLKKKDNTLLIISGCQGIGKTHLLKTVADHVNFTIHWHLFYCAVYVKVSDNSIMQSVSDALAFSNTSTIENICIRTKQLGKYKRWIFLLDNIMPENQMEAKEFAHAITYHCPKYKVVLGVTKFSSNDELQLGRFGIDEIKLLENSYNIQLDNKERLQMATCSYGLPVYIRFLFENRNHELVGGTYLVSDMGVYIRGLIKDNLSNIAKSLLAFIAFYNGINDEELSIKQLKCMTSTANDYTLDELYRFSLINIHDGKISIEAKIAETCRDILSDISSVTYLSIYECCCYDSLRKHIALRALLRSKKLNQYNEFTNEVMKQQHDLENYAYFVYIGRDYIQNQTHQLFCDNKDTRLLFWFYYFDSLLKLGMYPDAREALDLANKEVSIFGGILSEFSELQFQTQFLMIDLEHLTNHFLEASDYVFALERQCENSIQKNKCKYLYAHCLKHMGKDLLRSENIFYGLAYDAENSDISQKIRALYSLISIHIFWKDYNFDFTAAFSKINDWSKDEVKSKIIIPNVKRHYAYYLQIIKNNNTEAKKTLDFGIEMLAKKPQRIIYDFYFELGECFRLLYYKTHNKNDYLNSIANLKKAIIFAKEVGDYNLESMATLSKLLLIREKNSIKNNLENLIKQVNTIIYKTKKNKMYINKSFAEYVSYVLKSEQIPHTYIQHWQRIRYTLIAEAAEIYNNSNIVNIRLMVM